MRPFQPFERFEAHMIDEFVRLKKRYIVSQSYPRGVVHGMDVIPIVFTMYDDKGYALHHRNALKADQYASLIDLENVKHLEKVKEMLQPSSKYIVYISMVWKKSETEAYLKKHYDKHVERYINQHTTWRIPRQDEVVFPFKVIFGELYMQIKWKDNNLQVRFEDIEKA